MLQELQVHASIEEELLYPAAREAVADEDLVDEAEDEHETVHALIDQLNGMGPSDEKFAARFTVLCEYVLHHVKEEEGEMFPQLEKARLDWETLASQMDGRRAALMPADDDAAMASSDGELAATAAMAGGDASASRGSSSRQGGSSVARRGGAAAR